MAFGGNRSGVKTQINVTPLVDVTLVLLIIFIVVTPMLQRTHAVLLPTSASRENAPADGAPIVLVMTADKALWLGEATGDPAALEARLAREIAAHPARGVLLKADQTLAVGDVRPAMDLARRAGAKGVALGVKPVSP